MQNFIWRVFLCKYAFVRRLTAVDPAQDLVREVVVIHPEGVRVLSHVRLFDVFHVHVQEVRGEVCHEAHEDQCHIREVVHHVKKYPLVRLILFVALSLCDHK